MKLLIFIAVAFLTSSAAARQNINIEVQANNVAEIAVRTNHSYNNPFRDVDLDAVVTAPNGAVLKVPGFWDGEGNWKVRYSSSILGAHQFKIVCSDFSNTDLNGVTGTIRVTGYQGSDPLYARGALKVAIDRRHFAYSDGTPFFWLGDTWWKGLSKRITDPDFARLAEDRKNKGFTVVQIVAGPYPDEPAFDPRWANVAGLPYSPGYERVNPAYFDAADTRIRTLVNAGLMPAIVGGWGWHMKAVGVDMFIRHWRYLVARYAAFPVVWIIAGEASGPEWTKVGGALRELDPYHRLVTIHPPSADSARHVITDPSIIDFDMLQTGHDLWHAAITTVPELSSAVSTRPVMPVIDGEVTYEGHLQNREDIVRFMFWTCMLDGAAGHTYGASGIMQMNSEDERGAEYEFTPWSTAMNYPGSTQVGLGKMLLESYPWWQFEPHPEWVEPHTAPLLEPHTGWVNPDQVWQSHNQRYDLPFAGGIPGKVRFVYIPGGHPYNWNAPTVVGLEPNANYSAYYFDPSSGKKYSIGEAVTPALDGAPIFDQFSGDASLNWLDYGTNSLRGQGRLSGGRNLVTVAGQLSLSNAKASVGAQSNAEAGIMLRFHDAGNYVVAVYNPDQHAIYLHERRSGQWGEQLGRVGIPVFGPHIQLTAVIADHSATFAVTDGRATATTSSVLITDETPGRVGVWHNAIGDTQTFDNFSVQAVHLGKTSSKQEGHPVILHGYPDVLPDDPIPPISLIVSNQFQPPRLPAPQDWILVLEND